MTTALEQGLGVVTVAVETFGGFTNGKPTYGSSTNISAQVREQDKIIKNDAGEDVRVSLTLWVDQGESVYPTNQARVTYSGSTYIVEVFKRVTGIDGVLDHVKAMCREG